MNTEAAQKAWLQWFLETFGDDERPVMDVWENAEDRVLDERASFDDSTESFHRRSCLLPFLIAKLEASNLPYYRQLKECLKLRPVRKSGRVFCLGPTAGGEIEAISAAGGRPYLVSDSESRWQTVCEERLFEGGVWFENVTSDDFHQNLVNFRYVVISAWVSDPSEAVRSAYNALGEHGFVFFPATQTKLIAAATALGMRRQDDFQEAVAVYFKHPGAHDVCDEI
jgi:hypothetical protein